MVGVVDGELVVVAPPGGTIRFRTVDEAEKFEDLYAFGMTTFRRQQRSIGTGTSRRRKHKHSKRGPRS